jgi:hypothetical protein
MAKLKAATRNALPARAFGMPDARKYPMEKKVGGKLVPDKKHAADAKGRATTQVARGNLSEAAAARIRAKANRMLGE